MRPSKGKYVQGIWTIECNDWADAIDYLGVENAGTHALVWRGQSDDSWHLVPSLKREMGISQYLANIDDSVTFSHDYENLCKLTKTHLKEALRGHHECSEIIDNDEQLWAFAQHHGAATPLLDWTSSPFVAAFFAFADYVRQINPSEPPPSDNDVLVV